jgi:hypothetical protein
MKYFIETQELSENEILDALFEKLKPGSPTTIIHLFNDLNIKVVGNEDSARYYLEAQMINSGLLEYKKQQGLYFYTFKLTPNGLILLRQNDNKYSKYLLFKENEQKLKEQESKTSSTIVTNTISTNYGNANLSGHDSFLESADNNFPTHPQTTPTTNKAQKGYWLVNMLSNNWTITIVGSIVATIVTALIIYYFKIPH